MAQRYALAHFARAATEGGKKAVLILGPHQYTVTDVGFEGDEPNHLLCRTERGHTLVMVAVDALDAVTAER